MNNLTGERLADAAFDAYLDWRDECAAVGDAYDTWTRAPIADARRAFSAYRAALDREELASHAYAGLAKQSPTSSTSHSPVRRG